MRHLRQTIQIADSPYRTLITVILFKGNVMNNQTITYEIRLQPSVIAILAVLALGIFGLAFGPSGFGVGDAGAVHNRAVTDLGSVNHPLVVHVDNL